MFGGEFQLLGKLVIALQMMYRTKVSVLSLDSALAQSYQTLGCDIFTFCYKHTKSVTLSSSEHYYFHCQVAADKTLGRSNTALKPLT